MAGDIETPLRGLQLIDEKEAWEPKEPHFGTRDKSGVTAFTLEYAPLRCVGVAQSYCAA